MAPPDPTRTSVVAPYELAGEGDRTEAHLIDAAVFFGSLLLGQTIGSLVPVVVNVVLIPWAVLFVPTLIWGATIGKRFAGLRLIGRDGRALPVWRSAIRAVVQGVCLFIPVLWIVNAYLVETRSTRARSLSDLATGSLVACR